MRPALAVGAVVVAVTACGPSAVCQQYVACQHAADPSVDTTAYESGGSCWNTLQTGEACSARCRQALDALASVPEAPSECAETDAGPG